MTQEAPNSSPSYTGLVVGGLLISLCVFAVAGFILYSSICPCDRTPGGFLFGERVEAPVSDWSFANEVPLCQIQIWAGIRPHSINLNWWLSYNLLLTSLIQHPQRMPCALRTGGPSISSLRNFESIELGRQCGEEAKAGTEKAALVVKSNLDFLHLYDVSIYAIRYVQQAIC